MVRTAFSKRLAGAAVAASMILSPVAASAETAATAVNSAQVDPLVAFSLLGSPDSRLALCGLRSAEAAADVAVTNSTSSTATATTEQAVGSPGCVLPMSDIAPASAPTALGPVGSGVSPFLFVAAGAALALVIALLRDKGGDTVITPPPPPISPA